MYTRERSKSFDDDEEEDDDAAISGVPLAVTGIIAASYPVVLLRFCH